MRRPYIGVHSRDSLFFRLVQAVAQAPRLCPADEEAEAKAAAAAAAAQQGQEEGPEEPTDATDAEALRRDVVHCLAAAPRPHSAVLKFARRYAFRPATPTYRQTLLLHSPNRSNVLGRI